MYNYTLKLSKYQLLIFNTFKYEKFIKIFSIITNKILQYQSPLRGSLTLGERDKALNIFLFCLSHQQILAKKNKILTGGTSIASTYKWLFITIVCLRFYKDFISFRTNRVAYTLHPKTPVICFSIVNHIYFRLFFFTYIFIYVKKNYSPSLFCFAYFFFNIS